jgi:hypothetical protein
MPRFLHYVNTRTHMSTINPRWITPVVLLAGVTACGTGDRDGTSSGTRTAQRVVAPLTMLDVGAQPGSTWPNLASDGSGHIVLSWLEASPTVATGSLQADRAAQSRFRLRVSQLDAGRWTTPRTITDSVDFFVNWADFPAVAPFGADRLVAWWPEKRPGAVGGGYAYDAMVVTSRDRGNTWSAPRQMHGDGTPTEHGFVSFVPLGDSIGAVWLDGRDFSRTVAHPADHNMQLVSASISDTGTPTNEHILDSAVCTCCRTSATRTRRGVVVMYRDRKPGEVRDIAVARYENGEWSAPATLHNDGWVFPGCPVNGAMAASHGDTVAVAWFTAPHDSARVNIAFSTNGGRTFGNPTRVDDGVPVGRVGVLVDTTGSAVVTWIERVAPAVRNSTSGATTSVASPPSADNAELRVRRVALSGTRGPAQVLAISSSGRASGFPQIAALGDTVYLAWTTPPTSGAPSQIRVARTTLNH